MDTLLPSSRVALPEAVPTVAEQGRLIGLDAARALAVLAMVFGHTLDATLADSARAIPWIATYWKLRTFTAPLFLFVSGSAVMWVITRRQMSGHEALRKFLPRVLLLFVLGYCLRFPIWDLPGWFGLDAELWRAFLTFDALQCIAASLILAVGVCALSQTQVGRSTGLVLLSTLCVLLAPWVWEHFSLPETGIFWSQTLGGGSSRFSLFPWSAYFWIGAAFGVFLARRPLQTRALMGLAGLVLLALAALSDGHSFGDTLRLSDSSAQKFLWRLGPVMLLFLAALSLPQRTARVLSPVGRSSLWAYVLHLPICYGWGYWHGLATHVGKTLSLGEACLMACAVMLFTVICAPALQQLHQKTPWRELANRLQTVLLRAAHRPTAAGLGPHSR